MSSKALRRHSRFRPEQISDTDMVLLARDISKQIEAELEYPGQIKVNIIREVRATEYAK